MSNIKQKNQNFGLENRKSEIISCLDKNRKRIQFELKITSNKNENPSRQNDIFYLESFIKIKTELTDAISNKNQQLILPLIFEITKILNFTSKIEDIPINSFFKSRLLEVLMDVLSLTVYPDQKLIIREISMILMTCTIANVTEIDFILSFDYWKSLLNFLKENDEILLKNCYLFLANIFNEHKKYVSAAKNQGILSAVTCSFSAALNYPNLDEPVSFLCSNSFKYSESLDENYILAALNTSAIILKRKQSSESIAESLYCFGFASNKLNLNEIVSQILIQHDLIFIMNEILQKTDHPKILRPLFRLFSRLTFFQLSVIELFATPQFLEKSIIVSQIGSVSINGDLLNIFYNLMITHNKFVHLLYTDPVLELICQESRGKSMNNRFHAVSCLRVFARSLNQKFLFKLVDDWDVLNVLVDCLRSECEKVLVETLDCLNEFLERGILEDEFIEKNVFAEHVFALEGFEILQNLQTAKNERIFQMANELMDTYFSKYVW